MNMQQPIQQIVVQHLTDRGLWPHEADAILGRLKQSPGFDGLRLSDSADAYPPMMIATLLMMANQSALRYIDEEKPLHFARPMFI